MKHMEQYQTLFTSDIQTNGTHVVEPILIIFDSETVVMKGKQKRKYKNIDPKAVPIMRIPETFFVKARKSVQASRTEFPLFLLGL